MRVFVSYRREDNPWVAGRLRDRLGEAYGDANVFFDVDDIPLGTDFRDVIRSTLEDVDVVLAVIGAGWDTQRLALGADFVRAELLEALRLQKRLIPVLVGDIAMPRADSLPSELEEFAYLNAVRLRPDPDFTTDVARLVAGLRELPDRPDDDATDVFAPVAVAPRRAPAREKPRSRTTSLLVVALLLVVVGLGVAAVVLVGGGSGGDANGGDADPSSPALAMPPNSDIYQHPVTEVMPVLLALGLEAVSEDGDCSNTTDSGLVSQVTVGHFPDDDVIYGEEGQEFIDEDLRNHLTTGTVVTVWTPLFRPCP